MLLGPLCPLVKRPLHVNEDELLELEFEEKENDSVGREINPKMARCRRNRLEIEITAGQPLIGIGQLD